MPRVLCRGKRPRHYLFKHYGFASIFTQVDLLTGQAGITARRSGLWKNRHRSPSLSLTDLKPNV